LRQQGYKLVGEVAAKLGGSATTLRRMEEEGVILKAKRVNFGNGRSGGAQAARELKGTGAVEREG
jgi:hypothetical protein